MGLKQASSSTCAKGVVAVSIATDEDVESWLEVREPAFAVLEAQLAASPADRVFAWLQTRAGRAKDSPAEADPQIEKALLARNDPLINLGLAQYGIEDDTVKALFNSTNEAYRAALRLAVLSNQALVTHQAHHTGNLIEALIGSRPDVGEWLAGLSNEELRALFTNPKLDDNFLIKFLEQKKGWHELDERRQIFVLRALAKNPRMTAHYNSVIMDGYAEYKHSAVFSAAWQLAETVPVKIQWCWALYELFRHTEGSSMMKEPLEVAKRWTPDPADERAFTAEESTLESGYLGAFALLREEIARLAVHGSSTGAKLDALLTHGDVAVRLAACRYGRVTEPQITAAVARDPKFVFEEVVRNEWLWSRSATREILKTLAWDQPDPKSYMDAPNLYRHIEAEFRQKQPAWFKDEDQEPAEPVDEDTLPVTRGGFKEALAELAGKIEVTYPNLVTIQNTVLALFARSGWIRWGLATVVAILLIEAFIGRSR
jgi:hypothetical protein